MNPVLWLLFGAGGLYLYNKYAAGGTAATPGIPDSATTITTTGGGGAGPVTTVIKTEVPVVAPGGSAPTTQTITQHLTNYDPGNPQPGSIQMSADDLARKQGYYTPVIPPLTPDVAAIVARNNGDVRGVLASLAAGWRTTSDGDFKMLPQDWNYFRQMDTGSANLVQQSAVSSAVWNTPINQETYLGMVSVGGNAVYHSPEPGRSAWWS